MNVPYTHAMHWSHGIKEAQEGRLIARKHVQVRKYGVTYCAQLVSAYTTPTGLDCWTVETLLPEQARFTVPCRQVRECVGASCLCQAGNPNPDRASFSSHEAGAGLTLGGA